MDRTNAQRLLAARLGAPNWAPVGGAVNNRLIVPPTGAMQYYRLRRS